MSEALMRSIGSATVTPPGLARASRVLMVSLRPSSHRSRSRYERPKWSRLKSVNKNIISIHKIVEDSTLSLQSRLPSIPGVRILCIGSHCLPSTGSRLSTHCMAAPILLAAGFIPDSSMQYSHTSLVFLRTAVKSSSILSSHLPFC